MPLTQPYALAPVPLRGSQSELRSILPVSVEAEASDIFPASYMFIRRSRITIFVAWTCLFPVVNLLSNLGALRLSSFCEIVIVRARCGCHFDAWHYLPSNLRQRRAAHLT